MIGKLIFLVSVFISSISQILLKISANTAYKSKIKEYLNIKVILAYGMFFLSSILTILAYREVALSMGPILEATGYIWVTLFSYFILKEPIGKKKILGLVCIILGIVIFSI